MIPKIPHSFTWSTQSGQHCTGAILFQWGYGPWPTGGQFIRESIQNRVKAARPVCLLGAGLESPMDKRLIGGTNPDNPYIPYEKLRPLIFEQMKIAAEDKALVDCAQFDAEYTPDIIPPKFANDVNAGIFVELFGDKPYNFWACNYAWQKDNAAMIEKTYGVPFWLPGKAQSNVIMYGGKSDHPFTALASELTVATPSLKLAKSAPVTVDIGVTGDYDEKLMPWLTARSLFSIGLTGGVCTQLFDPIFGNDKPSEVRAKILRDAWDAAVNNYLRLMAGTNWRRWLNTVASEKVIAVIYENDLGEVCVMLKLDYTPDPKSPTIKLSVGDGRTINVPTPPAPDKFWFYKAAVGK